MTRLEVLVIGAALVIVAGTTVQAGDLRGPHVSSVGRYVDAARYRGSTSYGATRHDVIQARRALHPFTVGAPSDRDMARVQRRIGALERNAARLERQRTSAASIAAIEERRYSLPPPDITRSPFDDDLSGQGLPMGTAKRFFRIERLLSGAEGALANGQRDIAARQISNAVAVMAEIEATAGDSLDPDEPYLVVAQDRIAALQASLGGGG